jgi:hypothetical protein
MPKNLPRAITVASVTTTTVSVKCDRCKAVATGTCTYPNHAMFVARELKYITIHTNRGTRSMYPQTKVVCPACAQALEDCFLQPDPPQPVSQVDAIRRLQAEAWEEAAEAYANWNQSTPSGIPADPPRNPYDEPRA